MVEIRLTNSRTRRKEVFRPLDPSNVRMYLCGPTVYDRAHLGNARPVVVFDVLYRLLRHVYGKSSVTYVRNFTDVDDKINARAAETGRPIRDITDETIRWYHEDMDALGALRPDHEPRATDYIPQMIAMIEALIAKGHAYAAEGHVLFVVRSYPKYGALSGRSVDDMIAGARVEVAPFKRDPMDFVLWKPSSGDEPGWDSPWGFGRPGWHIECSAMSAALLGESFDIHGGGLDLMFPHHENEIAQSCCAHPQADFARVWLHNEMLQVEGKKMSKSLGNFFTVRDLLDQGVPGEVIRYVMLMTHYRKPMDWTAEKVNEAKETLRRWRNEVFSVAPGAPHPEILAALADDLNTPQALSVMFRLEEGRELAALAGSAQLLGLQSVGSASKSLQEALRGFERHIAAFRQSQEELFKRISIKGPALDFPDVSRRISDLQRRLQDTVSPLIEQMQKIKDMDAGTISTADPEMAVNWEVFERAASIGISKIIEERDRARERKDFTEADRLREEARSAGFDLIDSAEGTFWRELIR